ncbi:hypothetical protein PAECIP111893_04421 [Paenibacillus plantiphilus]|uniref:Uncharacterized protein n=1 Tax=Paenibacillus plantiphilus TaxID=2905650 RepID=A0ABM9CPL7_9BACL|nr:hypothetical protein PAECIP111893_04421 [Paenibacillus plantiphilus]
MPVIGQLLLDHSEQIQPHIHRWTWFKAPFLHKVNVIIRYNRLIFLPIRSKRNTAKMMNERIPAQQQLVARQQQPKGIIIILIITDPEPLIERTCSLACLAFHQKAVANKLQALLPFGGVMDIMPNCELLHLFQRFVVSWNLGHIGSIIRYRPDRPNLRIAVQPLQQALQPARRNNRIVIEQHHLLAAGNRYSLIASLGKTLIPAIKLANDILLLLQPYRGIIC